MLRGFVREFTCACVLALAACAAPAKRDTATFRLVGYVGHEAQAQRIAVEKLGALNYAFAHVDAGRVTLDPAAPAQLARLVALKSRNRHLKILLSIGGWGADGFSDAALTGDARTKFADSAAEVLAQNHLDGLDVDWEYPGFADAGIRARPEDERNFTLLLQTLRARFDRLAIEQHRRDDPYLITAALADREFVSHIELERVGAVLDWINLMTYDFHGSLTKTTGHHSALHRSATSAPDERSVDAAVAQYLAAGVPAEKLVVGVPFYGKAFLDVQPENRGLDEPFSGQDPVSVRLLRERIVQEHRRGATVLLSTHVMANAEEMCQHVVMIHQGRKVLDEAMAALRRQFDPRTIHFEPLDENATASSLSAVGGVERVETLHGSYRITLLPGTDPAAMMSRLASAVAPARIELARLTLEDVFVRIVAEGSHGKAASDALRASVTAGSEGVLA